MFKGPLPAEVNYRKFAGNSTKLVGTVPVSAFGRLSESIANDKGEVQAKLEFRRGKKQKTLIIGHISVNLELVCQNCLAPFSTDLESSFRWVLVEDEDALIALHPDDEGVICGEDSVNIVDLLEDELLVSLPMVAKHEEGECSFTTQHTDGSEASGESTGDTTQDGQGAGKNNADTYQPFASLAELKNQFDRS